MEIHFGSHSSDDKFTCLVMYNSTCINRATLFPAWPARPHLYMGLSDLWPLGLVISLARLCVLMAFHWSVNISTGGFESTQQYEPVD